MNIKILGPGCANCQSLYTNAEKALERLGATSEIEKVTDYVEMMSYGILGTPGFVVDGELIASGKVLSVGEIVSILQKR